jgi:nucleoid-associated protein YgaU
MPLPTSVFATQTPLQPPKETLGRNTNTVGSGSIAEVAREVTRKEMPPDNGLVPLIYKVQANDNLASIAKTFYGPVEGNRKINIDRIFAANRLKLKSPDEIYIGQKLIIPPLTSGAACERLSDVTIPVDGPSMAPEKTPMSDSRREINTTQWYVVRDGDSLWKIAQARLGNGARYPEIARLNTDVLSDEDNLSTGTRLRLPAP